MARNPRLGAKIKEARVDRGWKQKHLAAEVSVEPITVSRWERGATTPDLDVLGVVAAATGRPLSFFVDDADSRGSTGGDAGAAELAQVAERIERAATSIATESARLAELLESLRDELRRARGGSK